MVNLVLPSWPAMRPRNEGYVLLTRKNDYLLHLLHGISDHREVFLHL